MLREIRSRVFMVSKLNKDEVVLERFVIIPEKTKKPRIKYE